MKKSQKENLGVIKRLKKEASLQQFVNVWVFIKTVICPNEELIKGASRELKVFEEEINKLQMKVFLRRLTESQIPCSH